jgi:hypothetical protein
VALGVFGDVAEEEAERDFDALATDVAGFAVVEVFEHAELGLDAVKDFGDGGEEFVAVAGALVFGGEVGQLDGFELGAEGVSPEAVDRASDVAEVEGEVGVGLGRGPTAEVGEGVIEGAGQEAAQRIEIGVFAGQPRFHIPRISYGTNSTETSSLVARM